MALSDEDYGILLNVVEGIAIPDWDARMIMRKYMILPQDNGLALVGIEHQKCFAELIILSEGRELP